MASVADKIKNAAKNKAEAAPVVKTAGRPKSEPKLDANGVEIPAAPRKTNAELHVLYTDKLAKLESDYAAKKDKITKRLDELSSKTAPTNDLGKFLAEGKTEEDVEAQIKKLQKIRAAMKKHTPEELEALRAAAEAEAEEAPADADESAEESDEEEEEADAE